ncbi:hypothetical protein CAC42_684 [Sphaceloma murrayae]|uniref:Wings apart-like protein C-terminal domain-containing protein n=1 Tax=Sphaceloma murrayae TaxID=2082308 RepID=A0A2K1QJT5_9PEZI|nr:hypothetical protein CAC42_684 [Sphaceloma murrayae]
MATIFGSVPQIEGRKKTVTYGKLGRPSKRRIQTLPDEGTATTSLVRPAAQVKNSRAISPSRAASKSVVSATDEFDVPISDSDEAPTVRSATMRARAEVFEVPSRDKASRRPTQSRPDPLSTQSHSEADLAGRNRRQLYAQSREGVPSPAKKRKLENGKPQARPVARVHGSRKQEAPADQVSPAKNVARRAGSGSTGLKHGNSAPARLAKMLDETLLEEDTPQASPQVSARIDTIRAAEQTPPRTARAAPALRKTVSLTPNQVKLWDQLLDPVTDVAPIGKGDKKTAATRRRDRNDSKGLSDEPSHHPQLDLPPQAVERGRPRLADRLKHESQTMANSESSEDEDEDEGDELPDNLPQGPSQEATTHSQCASGPRNTYAQTRSYLQEIVSFEDSLALPLMDPVPSATANKGVSNDTDLDSEDEPSQGIRSIHELRAAGSKKRFLDDMDILLDDIKDHNKSGWSKRRTALMELSSKLEDLDFAARFIDNGFVTSLVQNCGLAKSSDKIGDSLVLVIMTQLSSLDLPRSVVDELVPIVSWTLDSGSVANTRPISTIAKDRESNMSRMSRESYIDFMDSLDELSFWPSSRPASITMDSISLRTLEALTSKFRRSGHRQPLINREGHLAQICGPVTTSHAFPDQAIKRQLALSVLESESLSIATSPTAASKAWTRKITNTLASFLADILQPSIPREPDLTLILRLLLNLTNNQPSNCAVFATNNAASLLLRHIGSAFTGQSKLADIDNATLDVLLLSLGLAINLAEHSDAVRRAALPTALEDVLTPLAKTFVRGREASSQADSLEESRANVAYGYLAVLLGNLCLNDGVKIAVEEEMGDLEGLVQAVEEFLGYHRRVDESQREEDAERAWEGFTERLGIVVERLREK